MLKVRQPAAPNVVIHTGRGRTLDPGFTTLFVMKGGKVHNGAGGRQGGGTLE